MTLLLFAGTSGAIDCAANEETKMVDEILPNALALSQ
jgi:hypothetical protein